MVYYFCIKSASHFKELGSKETDRGRANEYFGVIPAEKVVELLSDLYGGILLTEKSDGQLQAIGENAKDTFIILLIDQKTRRPVQCFIEVSSLFMTTNCLMGVT